MGRMFRERRNHRWVRYGTPWAEALADELAGQGARRAVVVVSPRRTTQGRVVCHAAGDRAAGVLGLARQHVPREVVDQAIADLDARDADAVIAVGGGSSIGLAKAVQLHRRRAFIALPTTYSGSEMTSIYGVRTGDHKDVGRDPAVAPDVVIYDPALTVDLPLAISVTSLFNAMAHAVDALYASGCTDEVATMAETSVAELARALRALASTPADPGARDDALHGAYLAGAILGQAGMALHHKLAHVLGGTFDLPHAATHTVILPHVVRFNQRAAPAATAILARALAHPDPAAALTALAADVGAPRDLGAIGLTADQARRAADHLATLEYDNPRQGTADELFALIDGARTGDLGDPS